MTTTFKHGENVIIRLTEAHEMHGDLQIHRAKFIRALPQQDWAEVELEKEHAGGTKTLHVPLEAISEAE